MTDGADIKWLLLGIEVTLVGIALELASSGAGLGLIVAFVGLFIVVVEMGRPRRRGRLVITSHAQRSGSVRGCCNISGPVASLCSAGGSDARSVPTAAEGRAEPLARPTRLRGASRRGRFVMRRRLLLIVVGIVALGMLAAPVASAASDRVWHDDFSWGPSDPTSYDNLCAFPVTVSSVGHFRGIELSDKAGNYIATEWFGTEQDTFAANGKTLVSEPYTFHLAYRQTGDGVALQWFGAGPVNRIVLPDGSIFLSAGRIDFLNGDHPSFMMVPDVGKAGDMAAFCAALS